MFRRGTRRTGSTSRTSLASVVALGVAATVVAAGVAAARHVEPAYASSSTIEDAGTLVVELVTEPAPTELATLAPGGWNDDAPFQLADGGIFVRDDLVAGSGYTISVTDLPEGWMPLPGASCTTPGGADSPIADIVVVAGEVTTCTVRVADAATITVQEQTQPDGDHAENGQLTISKSSIGDVRTAATGGDGYEASYVVDVANPGPGTATYTLTDQPAFGDGTTITSLTATGPDGDIVVGEPVDGVHTIVTGDEIEAAATESYIVTVTFTVDADMAATERACDGGSVLDGQATFNSATITFVGGTSTDTACSDLDLDDDTGTDTGTEGTPVVASADLSIVKTAAAEVVNQGDALAFDLVITNNGPNDATEVVVVDAIPAQLDAIAVTSTDFTCALTDDTVRCSRPSLAVGASGGVTIQAIVNAGVVGVVSNTASVSSPVPDPDPANNSSTASIDVPAVEVDPPNTPQLPETGSDVNGLVALAITSLIAGVLVLAAATRRRRSPWPPPHIAS